MIIGITGVKGAGKDTAAQFLIDTYDFQKVAFADRLKEAVANLFDIPLEDVDRWKNMDMSIVIAGKPMTFRVFLQRFGTEMGRNTFGKNFWVDLWENYLYQNSIRDDDIVVPDVRFQNEVERINLMGGVIIRITRPGHTSDNHESEKPLPALLIDKEIMNAGSISDLKVDVFEFYKGLTRNVS